MATTGIKRLDRNNPFTPETTSFVDLLSDVDLDEGMVRYFNEKKSRRVGEKSGVRGYPPPQATLDLHGEIASNAEHKTVSFIHTSGFKGLRTVRIITGKGLHSPGGIAILPDVVEAQLIFLKRDGLIYEFIWDKKQKAKSGSILVYI